MVQAKLESKKRIGILGGTFDPAHIGHIKISKVAKKILKLDKIIWAITNKNPFKNESLININKRIAFARRINLKNKFIEVKFYEKKIKSNKTIHLIKFLKKKSNELYFIIGADNLINFHKWKNYKDILKDYKIYVYPRGKSTAIPKEFKKHRNIHLFNAPKIEISSTAVRKMILNGEVSLNEIPKKVKDYITTNKLFI